MESSGTRKNWLKDPLNQIPTKKQMLAALVGFKAEPVAVEHNCTIRPDALQPQDLKGLRGHCTRCKRAWIKHYGSDGWKPCGS